VENSNGYKAENSRTLRDRPAWVGNGEPSPQEKSPYYFQSRGEGSTVAEASLRAENEVKRQIASFILADTGFRADTDTYGGRTVKTSGASMETKEEIEEKQYLETWIQSGASFAQAELKDFFWERVRTGNTEVIRYWVQYAVTESTVSSARRELKNRDKNRIPVKETEEFNKLRTDFGKVVSALDGLSFLDNEAAYKNQYEKLLAINARWQELSSQWNNPDYTQKSYEMTAAIRYYDPTDSMVQIRQENERLRIEQDIAKNERVLLTDRRQVSGDGFSAGPAMTSLATASDRLRMSGLISNGEYLAFLDSADKPDLFHRNRSPGTAAVHVSWLDAAAYCNWLSVHSGLDPYYTITGNAVQVNAGKNGYRLPAKEEIAAGMHQKIVSEAKLADMGVLGADSNRAYCFNPSAKDLRPIDGSFPAGNIGFMVVKNDK
jgi:hypothetical protein